MLNYEPTQTHKPIGVSKTIPDQTMSIRELVDRFARGLPVTGNVNEPQYMDPDDPMSGINPKSLDLSELNDLKLEAKQTITDLQRKLAEESDIKTKNHLKKALKAELEAEKLLEKKAENLQPDNQ